MKSIFHPSESRGQADHGWLNAKHSFSFANWQSRERMHFGALRVLNDDIVAAGTGFGKHPHDNMEIITIPLIGEIQHEDSMGHKEIIRTNQVQIMSAGSGIYHSEFNSSKTEELKLFQIWIFPDKENLEPRYATINYSWENAKNNFLPLVSPKKENEGTWIHQNAWIHIIKIEKAQTATYTIKNKDNGVYIMLIDGFIEIDNKKMKDRDAIGIWETESINIFSEVDSQLLLIEVPMKF
jgi:hypothetical protein